VTASPSPALGDPQRLVLGPGRAAMAARVTEPAELAAALTALGLAGPRPVLVLVGGADGLDPALRPTLAGLFRALGPVLRAAGAVVLDGGTRAGVMALMGEAAAETGIALLGFRDGQGKWSAEDAPGDPCLGVGVQDLEMRRQVGLPAARTANSRAAGRGPTRWRGKV